MKIYAARSIGDISYFSKKDLAISYAKNLQNYNIDEIELDMPFYEIKNKLFFASMTEYGKVMEVKQLWERCAWLSYCMVCGAVGNKHIIMIIEANSVREAISIIDTKRIELLKGCYFSIPDSTIFDKPRKE